MTDERKPPENKKSREQFLRVLESRIERCRASLDESVLIVGGSPDDEEIVRRAGFQRISNSIFPDAAGTGPAPEPELIAKVSVSGVGASAPPKCRVVNGTSAPEAIDRAAWQPPSGSETRIIRLDAEAMALPDDSFDLVFAHEVLHHCRSPHRALCEMLRAARKHVVFLEPNESLAMAALTRLRFSFPYELAAVADHDGKSGGVRDSLVPNFIYRWNRREVFKTVSSFMPERAFSIDAYPYWDFNATELDLELKKETRIGSVTAILGARNFLSFLRFIQLGLNRVPPLRRQGNKFFCCIEKQPDLKPWLEREGDRIVFRRHAKPVGEVNP